MTRATDPSIVPNTADWSWPLRFREHSFSAHCYDTYGCRVFYGGLLDVDDDPAVLKASSTSYGPDYRRNWRNALHGGLRNFPAPAHVQWRSKDGVAHEAHIDMESIFADQRLIHHVSREDIPLNATIQAPSIFLEVNDRTVNVYMQADIPTKKLQIPGNPYSNYVSEMVLVKSYHF